MSGWDGAYESGLTAPCAARLTTQLSRILSPGNGFDGQLSYPEYCRLMFEKSTPDFR